METCVEERLMGHLVHHVRGSFLLYDLPQQGCSVVRRHGEWKEHLPNAFSFEYGKDDAGRT